MFCPRCGQERVSEETSFCSRCGFLLTAVTGLLDTGGVPEVNTLATTQRSISPRSQGIRQGLFMFLLTFVIAPIVGLISQFGLGIDPWPVGIVVFGLGVGGLLRIAYAMMFESRTPLAALGQKELDSGRKSFQTVPRDVLQGAPARSEFQKPGDWGRLETNDLQPPSVTDGTTRLLEKDRD